MAPHPDGVDRFIDVLASDADGGMALLANVCASVDAGLSPVALVQDFFARCAQVYDPAVHRRPGSAVQEVCLGLSPPASPRLLRHAPHPDGLHDGTTWTTVMAWEAWWDWHVDRDRLRDAGVPVPMSPPPGDRDAQAQAVRQVTGVPGWWQDAGDDGGGWLGFSPATDGRGCWVSTDHHDGGLDVPPADCHGSADDVQQALGLYHGERTWLLRYSFSAASARRLAEGDVARPTFADLGNRRFRVAAHCDRADGYGRLQWGTTHHLRPADATAAVPRAGRPERVMRGVPLGELEDLAVEALGQVQATPGIDGEDDFVATLWPQPAPAGAPPRDAAGARDAILARVRALCRAAP